MGKLEDLVGPYDPYAPRSAHRTAGKRALAEDERAYAQDRDRKEEAYEARMAEAHAKIKAEAKAVADRAAGGFAKALKRAKRRHG
jgi:hypothetical protein